MPSRLEAIIGLLDEIIIVAAVIVGVLWLLVATGVISLNVAVIGGGALGLALAALAVVVLRPQWLKPRVGPEALVGTRARVVRELNPEGTVRVGGELWRASSLEPVGEGEEVEVVKVEGLTLTVRRPRRPHTTDR